jgi:hypothetical protein
MKEELIVGPQWNERNFRRRAILGAALLLASLVVFATAAHVRPLFDQHHHRNHIHSENDFIFDRRLKGGHTRKCSFELLETVPSDASAFTRKCWRCRIRIAGTTPNLMLLELFSYILPHSNIASLSTIPYLQKGLL